MSEQTPAAPAPDAQAATPLGVDADLLAILRCPVTRSPLTAVVDEAGATWLHNSSGLRYPVTDGIPVLLPDAGVPVPAGAAGPAGAADPAGAA